MDDWEELIWKATRAKAKAKMQSTSSRNIDQRCYCKIWLVYASLNKAIKDSKTKDPKSKAQESKALNSSLRPNQAGNVKTSDKVRKEKKKHWR